MRDIFIQDLEIVEIEYLVQNNRDLQEEMGKSISSFFIEKRSDVLKL